MELALALALKSSVIELPRRCWEKYLVGALNLLCGTSLIPIDSVLDPIFMLWKDGPEERDEVRKFTLSGERDPIEPWRSPDGWAIEYVGSNVGIDVGMEEIDNAFMGSMSPIGCGGLPVPDSEDAEEEKE